MAFNELALVGVDNAGNTAEFTGLGYLNDLLKAANYGQLHGFKNRLINGCFRINQRLVASNADDTYCLDRWYVLTQTGTVAVTQLTDPETGSVNCVRLTQSQASAQRMGLAQIIESSNCRDLRSVITTLAGRLRLSTSDNIRYAVIEHTGTADTVTSDIVGTWTSTTYTASNFFIAGINVLAVGQVAAVAATWRDLTALNATLGASANNIVVFVWTENAVAQNVTLDLGRMQWEPGAVASKYEQRPIGVELWLSQRYYWRVTSEAALFHPFFVGHCVTSTNFRGHLRLPQSMRTVPTFGASAASTFLVQVQAASVAATVRSAGSFGKDIIELLIDVASGLTAGNGAALLSNNTDSAYLEFSAEL